MGYLIGTDEAGYGPNLGPLVISATVWRAAGDPRDVDLYQRLAPVVTNFIRHGANCPPNRVVVADSKVLYKPQYGIACLERGFLAMLGAMGHWPDDWQQLWNILEPGAATRHAALPWHVGYRLDLPIRVQRYEYANELVPELRHALHDANVELLAIRSRAVFPEQFNQLTEEHGNKGAALSALTLGLVAELLQPLADEPVLVVCDKHGGRNRYGPLLQGFFPDLVEVGAESRQQSVYRFGPPQRRVEMRFRVGAESWLPAALASMASKYQRELAMRAFNDFWCQQVPQLRPTAGYPLDARRFRAEIRQAQANLGIDDRILWRTR